MKEKISVAIDRALLKEIDMLVDGFKIRNRSQAIEFLIRKALSERKIAVILAGGEEKRLMVNNTFKPLLGYKGKTAIEHIVQGLRKHGFTKIFIIGGKRVLSAIFSVIGDGSEHGVELCYVEERAQTSLTKQDTARTLKFLKGKVKKPFLCLYCDVLFDINLEEIWKCHTRSSVLATLVVKTSPQPKEWGNVVVEGDRVIEFVEKPKISKTYLVYTGMFIAEPEIFEQQGSSLEYQIFPALAKKGLLGAYIISSFCEHVDRLIS